MTKAEEKLKQLPQKFELDHEDAYAIVYQGSLGSLGSKNYKPFSLEFFKALKTVTLTSAGEDLDFSDIRGLKQIINERLKELKWR